MKCNSNGGIMTIWFEFNSKGPIEKIFTYSLKEVRFFFFFCFVFYLNSRSDWNHVKEARTKGQKDKKKSLWRWKANTSMDVKGRPSWVILLNYQSRKIMVWTKPPTSLESERFHTSFEEERRRRLRGSDLKAASESLWRMFCFIDPTTR